MRTLISLVLAVVVTGCQKTNRDAIDAMKPDWAKVRSSLPGLVALVRSAPSEGRLEGLSWVEAEAKKANVSFLTLEQLQDPDVELDASQKLGRLDLYEGGSFLVCLQWTGPRNPMSSSAMGDRNGDNLARECEAGLGTKYLVVLDTEKSTLPELTGEGTFAGGEATVRVTVLDRLASKALVSFTVEGKPGEVVHYQVRPGEEKAEQLAIAVHGTMWGDARRQIFERLRALGATVTPR